MMQGRNIQELAMEVKRMEETKRDFIADTSLVDAVVVDRAPAISLRVPEIDYSERFGMTDICHQQISSNLGIPYKYYNRMVQEAPNLWMYNVNHWLHEKPERKMIRTLDGNARAMRSPGYRRLDNYGLMGAILPVLAKTDMIVRSAEVTERKLWLKASFPSKSFEVKKGDVVEIGLAISNSEVGLGYVRVDPLVMRLVCLNGAVINDAAIKQIHVGRADGQDGVIQELLSSKTQSLEDAAFWSKVRDVVEAFVGNGHGDRMREKIERSLGLEIKKPEATVKVMAKENGLGDQEADSILGYLISGGDLSAWGLGQAVSRFSQDGHDYDRATQLEHLAGNIITLPQSEWKFLEEANN